MISNNLFDCLFQRICLESCPDVALQIYWECLLVREDRLAQVEIGSNAAPNIHLKSAQHNGDETVPCQKIHTDIEELLYIPPGARSPDHVKVFAWFRWMLGIDALHQPLKNEQRREAPNSTAIKA
jgi:hypothetical protein